MRSLRDLFEERPFAVALLVALVLLLVPYRTLLGPGVPSGRDLLPYFYPLKTHLAEALRAGEMPWIDRYRQGSPHFTFHLSQHFRLFTLMRFPPVIADANLDDKRDAEFCQPGHQRR